MIKTSGKMDKPNTFSEFNSDILFFIQGRTSSDSQIKNEILLLNLL